MKAIFVSNTAAYLLNMWLPLARALREQGADVILAAPAGLEASALVADGFRFESLPILRGVASTDRTSVVLGSGVDTRAFPASPLPKGIPVVLCAARLLWDKGIGEYVAAARVLRREGVSARFLLAGWRDSEHPAAIPESV